MTPRLIPPKTKVSFEIFKGITAFDLFVLLPPVALISVLIFLSGFPMGVKFVLVGIVAFIFIVSVIELNEKKGINYVVDFFKFLVRNKKIPASDFKTSTKVEFKDGLIYSDKLVSNAIVIEGIDFLLLTDDVRDTIIAKLTNAYKFVRKFNILKVDKPVDLPNYINKLKEKQFEWQTELDECSDEKRIIGLNARIKDIDIQLQYLEFFEENNVWEIPIYYFICYSDSIEELTEMIGEVKSSFENAGVNSHLASENELREMYELYYGIEFDSNDSFELPEIVEGQNYIKLNGEKYRILTLGKMPTEVYNAWGYRLFSIPKAKVLMKSEINDNSKKIEKALNKAISEKRNRITDKTPESVYMEIQNDVNKYIDLLDGLKFGTEQLHLVNLFIMIPYNDFKEVKQEIKKNSIFPSMLLYNQLEAYKEMQLHQFGSVLVKECKEMPTTTLVSMFPFINLTQMDVNGSYLGFDAFTGLPIFFDCFENLRNSTGTRSNANEVRFGQSGKGKSFSMKISILRHLAQGNRVLILDPEAEYVPLCKSFGGEVMDMASVKELSINPFEINASLSDEMEEDINGEEITEGEINSHRQYLSQFFRLTLPDMDNECRTLLDKAVGDLYEKFNITRQTNLKELKHTDYPLMNDLYDVIVNEYNKADTEYTKIIYRKIQAQLESFKAGGLNSRLWNRHTSIEISNDFTVFDFQSLLASSNDTVATGQMSLLMKILMQEIIKNKQFNDIQRAKGLPTKNIVVVVDEAHVFINPKVPIALEFMKNMAKRIRKYNGSLTITTQSIRDFTGFTGDTKALATAVINCCQYSTIFSLSEDDTNALIELYQASGGLTRPEIDYIKSAKIGQALMIVDRTTRVKMQFEMYDEEKVFIER